MITFKFHKVGIVYRPFADVIFTGPNKKPRKISMLVNTGSDNTILPLREAEILGIDVQKDCIVNTTFGVGGTQTVYSHKGIQVQLGDHQFIVPVGFLDTNDVPPLLGRDRFMNRFKICFANHTVSFERLAS
jgi:hypothetical protein